MKKFICLLFAGMIAVSALGCGSSDTKPKAGDKPAADTKKDDATKKTP